MLALVCSGALRVFGGFFGGGGGVLGFVRVCGFWGGYHSMGLGHFPVGLRHFHNIS